MRNLLIGALIVLSTILVVGGLWMKFDINPNDLPTTQESQIQGANFSLCLGMITILCMFFLIDSDPKVTKRKEIKKQIKRIKEGDEIIHSIFQDDEDETIQHTR